MASLVFDFGTRHIGIAVAEPRAGICRALRTVSSRHARPHWQSIQALVREWQPESFVVGLPLNMDGTRSDMCDTVEQFGIELESRYERPVAYVDERLSTYTARGNAAHGDGRKKGDHRDQAHADAAALIAETWMAALTSEGASAGAAGDSRDERSA